MTATQALFDNLLTDQTEGPVKLTLLVESARFNLRADPKDINALSKAFGSEIPSEISACARVKNREALCVGPDEWILQTPESDKQTVWDAFEKAYAKTPHSLTDISDREIAISMSGDRVLELLNIAAPTDHSSMEIGQGVRTIFDTVQVVLYREAENTFRMELWRSFLPHVWSLLNTGNAELASGY